MSNAQKCNSITNQFACMQIEPVRHVTCLEDDVREGLLEPPRSLPPKYFYDEKGSQLFAEICSTPEYYPTRTEDSLLANYSRNIIETAKPDQILELGSGNSQKTRRLFDACEISGHECSYAPFDVCVPMLEITSEKLLEDYNWLQITPMAGDYHAGLRNLPMIKGRRLYVFLGSTIGNFSISEAHQFLEEIRSSMQPDDSLLIGVDRVKDHKILDAAYNDIQGFTAEFNLNLLSVLNRDLDANFEIDHFQHYAGFNEQYSRIEMRLICIKNQMVTIRRLNEEIFFSSGDEILTEISHKYTYEGIEQLMVESGFNISFHYQPENQYFSLILAQQN